MAIKMKILSFDEEVNHHAQLGWQCPECYGIQIKPLQSRFEGSPHGFQCEECGCNWSRQSYEMEE